MGAICITLLPLIPGQGRSPDISGVWHSSIGQIYRIEVMGTRFTWLVEATGQTASGTISGRELKATWTTPRGSQSATGRIVEEGDDGRALRIRWSNGVIFTRPPSGPQKEIPEDRPGFTPPEGPGAANLTGEWRTNFGPIVHIEQHGNNLEIRPEGAERVFPGAWEGDRLRIEWPAERGVENLRSRIIERDPSGRVMFIEWSNGLIFERGGPGGERPERFGQEGPPMAGTPDISGDWFSNKGPRFNVHQTGTQFRLVNSQDGVAMIGQVSGEPPHWRLLAETGEGKWEGFVVETDPQGRAHLIEWTHGLLLSREPFPGGGEQPAKTEDQRGGIPDISGTWASSIKRTYEIVQQGHEFTWTVQGTNQKATGMIEGEHLAAEWSGGFGSGHAEGFITEADQTGRPTKIEWSNGVIFTRAAQAGSATPPEKKPTGQAGGQVQMATIQKGVLKAEIPQQALIKLIPHLSLKTVYNQWVKVGGPIGGLGYDVRHLANTQRGRNIIFVTDNYSGVNKSVDGGRNWFASNAGIHSRTGASGDAIPVFSLTVDPNNPNIVWAGMKDVKGVYKSTDAGTTWTDVTQNMPIPEQQFVFRGFTIMPGDSNIVFAQGEIPTQYNGIAFNKVKGRIYVTRDGGNSWSIAWEGNDLVRYVIIHPQNHNIIFASCGIFDREAFNSNCSSPALSGPNLQNSWKDRGGIGVLRSKDGGRNWEELNRKNGLMDLYVGSLVMHPNNPNILLAGCGNNAASQYRVQGKVQSLGGVFRTENGGDSWTQTLMNERITSVEFAPSNPNIAYAGGQTNFYVSRDAGKTWQLVCGGQYPWGPPGVIAGFPIDILVDPFNPNLLFVNNYGGGNVKSSDGGRTWELASQGYTGALMFDIVIHPTNSDIVYAGARSGLFRTLNGGAKWEGLSHPPAMFPECYGVALNPKNPQNVIASQELLGKIYFSNSGGRNWTQALQLPVIPGNALEAYGFKRIVFAPSAPHVVYAGTCRGSNKLKDNPTAQGVYKSLQGGAPGSWAEANNPAMKNQAVNDLAVHPNNHNIVYAATAQGGLFMTTDGGTNWNVLRGMANRDVRSVAIDPVDPRTIYAGLENGGVFRSVDAGNTWHSMAAGMSNNQPVWAIVVDPKNRIPWAGTQRSGVLRWDSIEQQWIATNMGLSTKAVVDLEISADGRVLYASTTGEGVFRYEKR